MFEEKMEKGLFTFYWEENEKENQQVKRNQAHSQLKTQTSDLKKQKGMEEKRKYIKHHKTQRQQSYLLNKHQLTDYLHSQKEVKNTLKPHHVTLSPQMNHTNEEKVKVRSIKAKRSKDLTNIKNVQSDRLKYEKIRNSLEALFFSDQPLQCHKKTIQIEQSIISDKNSNLNTLRPMKIRKGTLKQEIHRKQQDINVKLPIINAPQNQKNIHLPAHFGKYSQKKLKHLKENFYIQKLYLEKHSQEGNSIINIGVCSNDEYKVRWKKRKQEFLSLINKHISKQGLVSH